VNARQLAKQIQTLLLADVWPGTANPVWPSGSVVISAGPTTRALEVLRPPWVVVRIGSAENDPVYGEEPGLIRSRIESIIGVPIPGDALGEAAILGSGRQTGKSEGAGLLEVEERYFAVLGLASSASGIRIVHLAKGSAEAQVVGQNVYQVQRGYRSEAWISDSEVFALPTGFVATGGATVSLSWNLPPDRYDLIGVMLRRASGATPPADETAGTLVYQGALTSHVDSPGTGTYSYSLFGTYDTDEDTVVDSYSSGQTQASVVVT
jgi:hypothetical protein